MTGLARLALLSLRLGYRDPRALLTKPGTSAERYLAARLDDRNHPRAGVLVGGRRPARAAAAVVRVGQ